MAKVTEYFRGIDEMRNYIYYADHYNPLNRNCFYKGGSVVEKDEVFELIEFCKTAEIVSVTVYDSPEDPGRTAGLYIYDEHYGVLLE